MQHFFQLKKAGKLLSIFLILSLVISPFSSVVPGHAQQTDNSYSGEVENPSFETGDLSGWTVVEGEAFGPPSISADTTWWAEEIPYNQDGAYHLNGWANGEGEPETGILRSSTFTLGGSGWITFKLGGGKNTDSVHINVYQADTKELVATYGNTEFCDCNFPNVKDGMNLANMVKYKADLSAHLGENLYFEIVDQAAEDWGLVFADAFFTYHETVPTEGIEATNLYEELTPDTGPEPRPDDYYDEDYRPQYHFTPEEKWMNDPNGMVYYEGEYHLFYQHNPQDNVWGPMYWGHAVSDDLVNWEHQDIAIYPDENGYIWSGSAVVDKNDTTGFFNGESGLVAMFTYEKGGEQTQGLAYSDDNGRNWTVYDGNPVIDMPEGVDVFRDPKVFWHEQTNQWIMVLSAGKSVYIYQSPNLTDWEFASEFGNEGSVDGTWECPDLFEMAVDGDPTNKKWVLQVSVSDGAPAGGSGMQYFVGDFDGTSFTNENPADEVLWTDYGSDYYAAVSWSNTPENRNVWLGWMSNWNYAQDTPTDVWRSAMSIPRNLQLKEMDGQLRVLQKPVEELQRLRGQTYSFENEVISENSSLLDEISSETLEIVAEFKIDENTTAEEFGFEVRKGDQEETVVGYDMVKKEVFVDRTNAGASAFSEGFAAKHTANLEVRDNKVKMHLFVDRSSVELFANDGEAVFTNQIFPDRNSQGLNVYAVNGEVTLQSLTIHDLQHASFTKADAGIPEDVDVNNLPAEIENPSFETGDLTGWTTSGSAFRAPVTDEGSYWGGEFGQEGNYHVWGFAGAEQDENSDFRAGEMKSSLFRLDGNGMVNFLVAGGEDIDKQYVALVRASDSKELFKTTGHNDEKYRRVSWNASEYVGEAVYIKVVDHHSGGFGHLNVDDFQVYNTLENSMPNDIENPGFETGDLSGWQVLEGDAFSNESVSDTATYWDGVDFRHEGDYHLWGAANEGDNKTGTLKSSHFKLAGTGQINFLLGGGNDPDNLYVALVRAADNEELMRAVNTQFNDANGESYHRVTWDASSYIGEEMYIKIVNNSTGGWAHINVDDFQVLNEGKAAHWSFDEGSGNSTADQVSGEEDAIKYVFNNAKDKPDSDPLWKEGISGNALLFDGYSTWIERNASEITPPTSALTIEGWVAPRGYEWGHEGKLSTIVNQHNRSDGEGYLLGMGRHGSWSFQAGLNNEWVEVWADETKPLEKDKWSYIVATFDQKASKLKLYLNGELVGEKSTPIGATISISEENLRIGKHNNPSVVNGTFDVNMFNGLMDELKIHHSSFTEEEVKAQYNEYVTTFDEGKHPDAQLDFDRSRYNGDRHRPQYHFTAPEHWMNEPHAPLYFDGKYHLFYQFNPQGPYWSHIHWGHAVSEDLVHWEDQPVAIAPQANSVTPDGVWSGSSAVDDNGNPVLFFTAGDDSVYPNQRTGLARSTFQEDGNSNLIDWVLEDKPVTVQEPDLPAEEGDIFYGQFRDPFVWKDGDTWYQLVTSGVVDYDDQGGIENYVGGTALLYTTQDPSLENWTYQGPFFVGDYKNQPKTGQVWELPVLLPLRDEEGNKTDKYAFFINPWFDGYSEHDVKYTFYWIGEFDKENYRFVPDHEEPKQFDYGEHFTGPSGFVDDKGRSVLWSIAQDKRSEQDHYDAGWAHNAGLPLSLHLRDDNELGISPLPEMEKLRGEKLIDVKNKPLKKVNEALADVEGDMLEVRLEIKAASAEQYGLKFRQSKNGAEETLLYYDEVDEMFAIDRNKSSLDPDVRKGVQQGNLRLGKKENFELTLYLDRSMVEAYANGHKSITSRVYPTRSDSLGLELWSDGQVVVKSMEVWEMTSAYGPTVPAYEPELDAELDTINLPNYDFQTGDLSGWIIEKGNTFTDDHITDAYDWGWGGPFNQAHTAIDPAHHHLWGYNPDHDGDAATGVMKSQNFILGGEGQIDFLLSGGDNIDNLYIALVRASNGEQVMKATGHNHEGYRRVKWDASEYIGEELYLKVVDSHTGGWGHINLDNVNVQVDPATEFK